MRRNRALRGFVLLTTAAALVLLIGVLGLCLDLGRLYITRNELQAYVDAAAVSAAYELDGTREGIAAAVAQATSNSNRWNFQTAPVEDLTVTFAIAPAGPYVGDPEFPDQVRFVRVLARAEVLAYFMVGTSRRQTIEAAASSGQSPVTVFRDHLIPYSPDAIRPEDPNFGYTPGGMYTLRWPPPGRRSDAATRCSGDKAAGFVTPSDAQDHGLIDIGDPGGPRAAGFLRNAILNGAQTHPLALGDVIEPGSGDWQVEADALDERFAQDTDTASATYEDYAGRASGNGRRFVVAPVNDSATGEVLGFAGFFLHREICGEDERSPCCAEYVGAALLPGRKAAGPPGAYRVKLIH